MLVVLDANVFVSAAIQRGASYRIVQSWLAGGASFEVVMCPALLEWEPQRPPVITPSEFEQRFGTG